MLTWDLFGPAVQDDLGYVACYPLCSHCPFAAPASSSSSSPRAETARDRLQHQTWDTIRAILASMAPNFPPVASNATLHALTERLASHSRNLPPLIGSQFTSALSLTHNGLSVAAAGGYKQPAPPPTLPKLQLIPRHQDPPVPSGSGSAGDGKDPANGTTSPEGGDYLVTSNGTRPLPPHECPLRKKKWPQAGKHDELRCGRCSEDDMEGFVWDMGVVMRREFDSWVEQCWSVIVPNTLPRAS